MTFSYKQFNNHNNLSVTFVYESKNLHMKSPDILCTDRAVTISQNINFDDNCSCLLKSILKSKPPSAVIKSQLLKPTLF